MAFIKSIYVLFISLLAVTVSFEVQFTAGRQLKAFKADGHGKEETLATVESKTLRVSFAVGHTVEGSFGDLKDTEPGHSPGIGHSFQTKNSIAFDEGKSKDRKVVVPGHSPGIGHALKGSSNDLKAIEPGHSPGIGHAIEESLEATMPDHSPGIGHSFQNKNTFQRSFGDLKDTTPGHSPGIGHSFQNKNTITHTFQRSFDDLKDTTPGHSPGIGHSSQNKNTGPNE